MDLKRFQLIRKTTKLSLLLEIQGWVKVQSCHSYQEAILWSVTMASNPTSTTQIIQTKLRLGTRSILKLPFQLKQLLKEWLSMTVLDSKITKAKNTKYLTHSLFKGYWISINMWKLCWLSMKAILVRLELINFLN